MNVQLLRKIKKHILEEPKRLYMSGWIRQKQPTVKLRDDNGNLRRYPDKLEDDHGNLRPYPRCGTAGCIAGWAFMLSRESTDENTTTDHIRMTAITLLEINLSESDRLFSPINWPNKFYRGTVGDGKLITAKIAARRIEHFIKTGGRE